MNKHGAVFFLKMMIAIVVIILALAFAPVVKQFADTARNSTTETQIGLDCSNSSISDFDKANCLYVDYQQPLFIGFLVFLAGAIIVARLI